MNTIMQRYDELLNKVRTVGRLTREESIEIERLQKIKDELDVHRQQSQQRLAAESERLEAETKNLQRQVLLGQIFRTVFNNRVPVDNTANQNIILGWLHPGETPSGEWFIRVLTEQPALVEQLSWQSADVVNPAKQAEAQRKQLVEDRRVFEEAAKATELYSVSEANFSLIREKLGSPFNGYHIKLAIDAGHVLVFPPSSEELQKWRSEKQQERQSYLINQASPEELRAVARQEASQNRQAAVQTAFERELEQGLIRDITIGKMPRLPETWNGEVLDKNFIRRASADTLKQIMRRFGSAQLNARLYGITKVGSFTL